jgi:uncharacterized protein YndB with AHSA1/START domain
MTLIGSDIDPQGLTLTMTAEFDAEPERVWALWDDPRQLERWWGPPGWPATFTRHEFEVGGESRYHMTGPAGELARGWWRIDGLERPVRIAFFNGLAGDDGEPAPGIDPMTEDVRIEPVPAGTRMTILTRFTDSGHMQTMIGMGMQEGMRGAISQIDEILAGRPAPDRLQRAG